MEWTSVLPLKQCQEDAPARPTHGQRHLRLPVSPYLGAVRMPAGEIRAFSGGEVDPVSVADILRNTFVYPPHSIFRDVELLPYEFQGQDAPHEVDGAGEPASEFRFRFREAGKAAAWDGHEEDWPARWHHHLCAAAGRACAQIQRPWLLQSGGKDSTSLAIALAQARPDTTCITYLGGDEENEVASARHVARSLGLRHEALVCDPGRAYDRYLAIAPRMPSLTADFALLSYVDLLTTIAEAGGDGVVDGMGSDFYFGGAINRVKRLLPRLALDAPLPAFVAELPLVRGSFELCFLLGSLQMNPVERIFPGSRFTDAEVRELFGRDMVAPSRARLRPFLREVESGESPEEQRAISMSIACAAGGFAKGIFTANAFPLQVAYPYCDPELVEWIYRRVPREQMVDARTNTNKVLVRAHIARHFGDLPYVRRKGSFRFDVRGLARQRFEQVHAFAGRAADMLPGAVAWLERNRACLDNKYFASKFYLLAVVLPWLAGDSSGRPSERGAERIDDLQAASPAKQAMPPTTPGKEPSMPATQTTLLEPHDTPGAPPPANARLDDAGGTASASGVPTHARKGRHMQITMSPFYGKPDFSALTAHSAARERIDLVSVADILRNAAVFPPHSIFEGTKMATFGFDPNDDMTGRPPFTYRFRESEKATEFDGVQRDWVAEYHQRLCGAVERSCAESRAPWQLQSGGKDSTSLAIAIADARPDTVCITYLGGREENEVESARRVATTLGLRHETLVCDPGRAYDRYLRIVDRMPLLSADFALLSYVDLGTEIVANGGDGMIDGQGSDNYFGAVVPWRKRLVYRLAMGLPIPQFVFDLPLVRDSFRACYALGTLKMSSIERVFPGSRFTDEEVDALFGRDIARQSRSRLSLFEDEIRSARTVSEWRDISMSLAGSTGGMAKGLYTASALGMHAAYPYCDAELAAWVYRKVPREQLIDPASGRNKVLVRKHIGARFTDLPYVDRSKGSFRFDVVGLARQRYDEVYEFARQERDVLPGAEDWLRRNRTRLDNKYFASKFYLLAIVLPWLGMTRHHSTLAA